MQRPSITEIAELIGQSEAESLISQIGGITFYFPLDCKKSAIVKLSDPAWSALCKAFGSWVYIPKNDENKRAARNLDIRKLRAEGAQICDLAIQFKLSDRQIKTIVAGVMKMCIN